MPSKSRLVNIGQYVRMQFLNNYAIEFHFGGGMHVHPAT